MKAPPVTLVPIPADLLAEIAPKTASWCSLNFKYNNIFDNSAAIADLGFKYTITWEEGVRRMVQYHDSRGNVDNCPQYPLYDQIIEAWRRTERNLIDELSVLDV